MKKLLIPIIFVIWAIFACSDPETMDEFDSIRIISPSYSQHYYTRDMPINLDGRASSIFKNLSGRIKWTSSISGELGSGRSIQVNLKPGEHIIKAVCPFTYEDFTASVKITVEEYSLRRIKLKVNPVIKVKDQDGAVLVVDRNKQVITDTSTGLMWERSPDSYQYNYNEALSLAKNSQLGGYTNWRLPTLRELSDICNLYNDGRDATLNSEFISMEGNFWTSITVISLLEEFFLDKDGIFKFTISQINNGAVTDRRFLSKKSYADINSNLYVRLVRSIK